jgi:hypothetical protein
MALKLTVFAAGKRGAGAPKACAAFIQAKIAVFSHLSPVQAFTVLGKDHSGQA